MGAVTIREIPEDVHDDLFELARLHRRSLQQELVEILTDTVERFREQRDKKAVWATRNGVLPVEYPSAAAAKQAVVDVLATSGLIGESHLGVTFVWGDGDWRAVPDREVPEGFQRGWELFNKNITTGQRVFERSLH